MMARLYTRGQVLCPCELRFLFSFRIFREFPWRNRLVERKYAVISRFALFLLLVFPVVGMAPFRVRGLVSLFPCGSGKSLGLPFPLQVAR